MVVNNQILNHLDVEPTNAKILANNEEVRLLKSIAVDRDRIAMRQLYQSYRRKLGSFLFRITANTSLVDEVYNEVMLIVWRKAQQFDGRSKASTWIYSIAYRQCLAMLRKEGKHENNTIDEQLITAETKELEDEKQLIQKALTSLSDNHQRVIELSYFVGCNYKEIGEIVGCSENTIKTRMFHAKRYLKENLIRLGGSDYS